MSLDFSGTGLPLIDTTAMTSYEATASVCDKQGNLLFYTNGNAVWNRADAVMPNGSGILGNTGTSSFQGVVIVPFINNSNKYYLFVSDANEVIYDENPGYLRYSVIDMTLNGGLGDVIPFQKNIIIDSMIGEMMTSIKGEGCYIWLLVHHIDTSIFHAFKISDTGLEVSPVLSNSGKILAVPLYGGRPYSQAYMKGSPNGNYISNIAEDSTTYVYELHEFDKKTGQVFNGFVFSRKCYGTLAFSNNSNFLYTSEHNGAYEEYGVYQYDLSNLKDRDSFINSTVKIHQLSDYNFISDFRMAPDKRIYMLDRDYTLSRINFPDLKGLACSFEANVLALPRESFYLGSPVVPTFDTVIKIIDSFNCSAGSIIVKGEEWDKYIWSSGETTKEISVNQSVKIWVTNDKNLCNVLIDTFIVRLPKIVSNIQDTILCKGQLIMLHSKGIDAEYLWSDGSRSSTFEISKPGEYWVSISTKECSIKDSFTVADGSFQVNLGDDRVDCLDEETVLTLAQDYDSFLWQDGSLSSVFRVNESGDYWVSVSKKGCVAKDTITVAKVKCSNCLLTPNAFTPNNDGRNDKYKPAALCPVLEYSFKIFNRYGQQVFSTNNLNEGWDGRLNGTDETVGVYYYLIKVVFDKPQRVTEIFKGDLSLLK